MWRFCQALLLVSAIAQAQTAPTGQRAQEEKPAAIRGVVRDQASGNAIEGAMMALLGGAADRAQTATDAQGHYAFKDLKPGSYVVSAQVMGQGAHRFLGPRMEKRVSVRAGQELESCDFRMPTYGKISGKVVDQNGEPMADVIVALVARVYSYGTLRHVYSQMGKTDDRGIYTFPSVAPGRSFLIHARKVNYLINPVSEAPADPKLRKRATVPTFYPSSETIEGAAQLLLDPGENREGVDITMARTPSYCMETEIPAEAPEDTRFSLAEAQPTFGWSDESGLYGMNAGGQIKSNRKLRVCDLHTGEYELDLMRTSDDAQKPVYYSKTSFSIRDEDVKVPAMTLRGAIQVRGEIVWDGSAPAEASNVKVSPWLMPMYRPTIDQNEIQMEPYPALVPGALTFPHLYYDDYTLKILGVPKPYYVKDIVYGTASILHAAFHPGSAVGNATLRVVIGTDGGTLNVQVQDKGGNPVPDIYVVLIPAEAANEAALAETIISGQTDDQGAYSRGPVAPGKYYVTTSPARVPPTPEAMTRLVQARIHAQEVEVGPKASVNLTLTRKDE
ncbi:MAG: carboxypeptidase-like regulatory domain-containing protein [Bryobacteraceae bacterium]|nr:carboxypeptidase-like regulatory domain-containing protein [Bryobacteraceae bacterium]